MICNYADNNKITLVSAFNACADGFDGDTTIDQDLILEIFRNLGTTCDETTPPPVSPPIRETALLNHVIDGDTISVFLCPDGLCTLASLDPVVVRLWRVSANELGNAGYAAKEWVINALGGATGVELTFDRKGQDTYDRILALVYSSSGQNINTGLVEAGLARPWTADESVEYEQEVEPIDLLGPIIEFVGITYMPETINVGYSNEIRSNWKNVGGTAARYWLGVRLVDKNSVEWRYTGDRQYASLIEPGQTRELRVYFTPPTHIEGPVRTFLILNRRD
jgi:endonuclease YncB( thermonuclease family)